MRRRIARAAVVVLLACLGLLPAAKAPAQCAGSAQSATTAAGNSDCDIIFGDDVPYLKWSFQLLCFDGCGQLWYRAPIKDEQATGACAAVPQTLCVPFFDQRDYSNGMYAVTTSRDQYVAMGCRFGETRYTDGSCPCAPSCDEDEETPMQYYQQPGYGSPVLLSFGDGRHELTSAAEGVLFDIDGDGRVERVAWTRAEADEAFLALDRDGSGTIDSGRELFGDASPQLPSAEANGFRALALFDEPHNGGDGDGWIGPEDAIFARLLLWRDADHDGVSQPDELVPADGSGLEGIDLAYRPAARQDEHGNQFRYAAATRWQSGAERPAWDVFFTVLPP
jgi:hypothetical protein